MIYVVAVSGGVDSVVLLHRLVGAARHTYVVAHVDHGIRADSERDAAFVEQLAKKYGLTYETTKLHLGADCSEERARQQRYAWLATVRQKYQATAIMTAHHQDDVLETITINCLRGTGWRGLSALRSHDELQRPLLTMTKVDIVAYAIEHGLDWREDATNDDVRYLRNYVRHGVVARLTLSQRQNLMERYAAQCQLLPAIDQALQRLLEQWVETDGIRRHILIMSDDLVARELLAAWLGGRYEKKLLDQLVIFTRTARPGKTFGFEDKKVMASKQYLTLI